MAKQTKRGRSLAAKKGWVTRRKNARARSAAAKRGWITRRKKSRAQKLTGPTPEQIRAAELLEVPEEYEEIGEDEY